MKTIFIYAAFWIGMAAIGILNGILREYSYGRYMHELSAHQLSTMIGIVLFGVYIWFLTIKFRLESGNQALLIGAMWLIMTVLFEFVFGYFVMGQTWHTLFQDYNLFKGRVWSLVLIWITMAPYICYRVRS